MYKVRAINFGWYRRKHGILLENLPPAKQKLIKNNDFFKWLDADTQAIEVIFKLEDNNDMMKVFHQQVWNPFTEQISTKKELDQSAKTIEWSCAICKTDILCKSSYTKKVENFVCDKCSEVHNSKNKIVDQRIIDSSNEFTEHCRSLLKKEQKEFIKYARKTAKS